MTDFSMRNEPLYGTSSIIGITDIINEITTGVGVTVDGVLLKDGIVSTDTINEITTGSGVTVEGVLLKDSIVSVDTINEQSINTGVTVEGVLLKDSIVSTDIINEQSSGVGVTIDGVLLKDSIVSTDTINEQSINTGVTIDGVLLKDSIVSVDTINEQSSSAGVTIEGVLLKTHMIFTDFVNEETAAEGVTIDGVLLKDSIVNTNTISPKSGTTTTVSQDLTIQGHTNAVSLGLQSLNINTGGGILTTDTNNSDISQWLQIVDVNTGLYKYIPCYSSPNLQLPVTLAYVPCSSWMQCSISTGNDQDDDIVWETNSNSVDNEITLKVDNKNIDIQTTGTYLIAANMNFDITVAAGLETYLRFHFTKGVINLISSLSSIPNLSAGNDFGGCTISCVLSLVAADDYSFTVFSVEDDVYTRNGTGSITRIA
jgi:hypothetical protein